MRDLCLNRSPLSCSIAKPFAEWRLEALASILSAECTTTLATYAAAHGGTVIRFVLYPSKTP